MGLSISNIVNKAVKDGGQAAASLGTTALATQQAFDALYAEAKMAFLTHQAREQGLWSVATKQADSQSTRMTKQSEVWGQI